LTTRRYNHSPNCRETTFELFIYYPSKNKNSDVQTEEREGKIALFVVNKRKVRKKEGRNLI